MLKNDKLFSILNYIMTTYFPPLENVPIFDPILFSTPNESQALSVVEGNRLYLQYPFAQGTETFPANIVLNGTTNSNYIQFPDGSKQYKASSGNSFQPTFTNFANRVGDNTNYITGTAINFNGSWNREDYAIFRISQQYNWQFTSNEYQYSSSSKGILICRPYYMPPTSSGPWASRNYPQLYTTNENTLGSGFTNYAAPTKQPIYYVGNNTGDQDMFGLGGEGKFIYFVSYFPTIPTGGYGTTLEIEYMARSSAGGTVSFTNGTGNNNSLP
jgi:hypothetical protein